LFKERVLFEIAVRMETFSLGELWDTDAKYVGYGHMSRILLKWWREDQLTQRMCKAGKWHDGFPWSKAGRGSIYHGAQAMYRWKE
jgi:hypothetical protein